MIFYPIEENSE
jgi:hypothetical protein